jgi:hypothetical protein
VSIHSQIKRAGGLANVTDLGKQFRVSRQRAAKLTQHPGFPEPVGTVGGRPVWLASEAQQWRDKQTQTNREGN